MKTDDDAEIDVRDSCTDLMRIVTQVASLKLSQILEFVASEGAKDVRNERERCAQELDELARNCRERGSAPERIAIITAYEAAAAHIRDGRGKSLDRRGRELALRTLGGKASRP